MSASAFRDQDNGKSARISVGATFEIVLKENPTTGYKWTGPVFDARLLGLEADEFQREDHVGVGGGGTRRFIFSGRAKGETSIHLGYKRSWENDENTASTFKLKVEVVE